jgi:hypothetical protein
MRSRVIERVLVTSVLALAVGGCSMVPNMDRTSGCNNRAGNGPRDQGEDPEGIPLAGIEGLTPMAAAAAASGMGHVVVFRLDSMDCVCVPPAGYGPVAEGWWGSRGQLFIDLQYVEPQGQRLANGTGC